MTILRTFRRDPSRLFPLVPLTPALVSPERRSSGGTYQHAPCRRCRTTAPARKPLYFLLLEEARLTCGPEEPSDCGIGDPGRMDRPGLTDRSRGRALRDRCNR